MNEYVKQLVDKYHKEVEALTKEQFEDALHGAIISGDFVRHVQGDPVQKQGMTYIPFREREHSKMRYEMLEQKWNCEHCRAAYERGGCPDHGPGLFEGYMS
jgi:hypothetical protein